MNARIPKLDASLFTSFIWEGGTVTTIFGWPHRYESLLANKEELVLYACGYCPGSDLLFRSKLGWVAVMFEFEDIMWWNHFTEKEFLEIFCFPST